MAAEDLSDTISRVRSASDGTFPCISRSVKHLEGQGELPAADMQAESSRPVHSCEFSAQCILTNVGLDRFMDGWMSGWVNGCTG
jgi:hypothetical protein